MALNNSLNMKGKTRFTGSFLKKNGMKYNDLTGKKLDPNKSYVRDTESTLNEIRDNNQPSKVTYRGSYLKKNGINYNPYNDHREAIDPNKDYQMNRNDIGREINLNHQPARVNYRGSLLKDHGLKYDSKTGEKFDDHKLYNLDRHTTDDAFRQNDYEKNHPYSSAHPNLGLKGDLKRKFRLHRNGVTKHQTYTGSYLKQNGIKYNPYSNTKQKIDPNKSYSMPKKLMDSEIKDDRKRANHPYSYYHPNRGFVGDMIHKGTLDARGIKNTLNYKMKHAFAGGLAHKVSDQRPEKVYSGLNRHIGGAIHSKNPKMFGNVNTMKHGLGRAKGVKRSKSMGKLKNAKIRMHNSPHM